MIENRFASKEDWIIDRVRGIGGSEVAAILGLDPYKTAYTVWLEKTSGQHQKVENAHIRSGLKLEKVVVEYFAEETKYPVIYNPDEIKVAVHSEYDYMRGTRDAEFVLPDGDVGILECKTTQHNINKDELPMTWYCQIQWYLGIYKKKRGALAWLERGIRFDYLEIDFNEEFFNYLVQQVKVFWETFVIPNVEPELKTGEDVNAKYPFSRDKEIEATPELYELYQRVIDLRAKMKELETEEEKIIEQFKLIMRECERCSYAGAPIATWKSVKPRASFDSKALEKDMPEVYAKYTSQKEQLRRFAFK